MKFSEESGLLVYNLERRETGQNLRFSSTNMSLSWLLVLKQKITKKILNFAQDE